MKNSIDGSDIILSIALIGGFVTGFWLPSILIVTVMFIAQLSKSQ